VGKEHVTSLIADCSVKECQVVYSIIELVEVDDITAPRTAEIIQRYETVASRSKSAEIIGDRMVARYLESFVERGLLRTSLHHHSEGTWRDYEIDLNLSYVLSALNDAFPNDKIEMHNKLSQW
jgi:cell division control protein 6